jgi:hypothetical protein
VTRRRPLRLGCCRSVSGLLEAVSSHAVAHGRCTSRHVIPVLSRLRAGDIVVACIHSITATLLRNRWQVDMSTNEIACSVRLEPVATLNVPTGRRSMHCSSNQFAHLCLGNATQRNAISEQQMAKCSILETSQTSSRRRMRRTCFVTAQQCICARCQHIKRAAAKRMRTPVGSSTHRGARTSRVESRDSGCRAQRLAGSAATRDIHT